MKVTITGGLAIAVVAAIAMEGVAWCMHRYVMHGIGWRLHRSHHRVRKGWFEANDLYGLLFALISMAMILAAPLSSPIYWIGVGMALYGLLYAILHDVLIHRRLPFRLTPRGGYLRRLIRAHHLHHRTTSRDGALSFGFLYARPPALLIRELRRDRGDGRE